MKTKAQRELIAKRLEVSVGTIERLERVHPEMMHLIILGIETETSMGTPPQYRSEITQARFEKLYDNLIDILKEDSLVHLISVYTGHHKATILNRISAGFNIGLERNKLELIEAMEAIKMRIPKKDMDK